MISYVDESSKGVMNIRPKRDGIRTRLDLKEICLSTMWRKHWNSTRKMAIYWRSLGGRHRKWSKKRGDKDFLTCSRTIRVKRLQTSHSRIKMLQISMLTNSNSDKFLNRNNYNSSNRDNRSSVHSRRHKCPKASIIHHFRFLQQIPLSFRPEFSTSGR